MFSPLLQNVKDLWHKSCGLSVFHQLKGSESMVYVRTTELSSAFSMSWSRHKITCSSWLRYVYGSPLDLSRSSFNARQYKLK